LLRTVFAERRNSGAVDLEALEQATRDALHRAGAAALERLLNPAEPSRPRLPCACGGRARCAGRRPKKLVTTLGEIVIERPYYHCGQCGRGFAPRDRQLDVEATRHSPGVRRMAALVGSETSFERGRALLDELAGVALTAKAVEREAEAIGAAVAAREQAEIDRAIQLDLPETGGPEIPVLYLEMDGTGVPAAAAATAGRAGKDGGAARTREVKLGCVFTQARRDEQGRPVRDEGSTSYTGAIEDAAAWIWNLAHEYFPGAVEIVDLSITPASTCGSWRESCSRTRTSAAATGRCGSSASSTGARSSRSSPACAASRRTTRSWRISSRSKPTISSATPCGCATTSFADRACLWARA